jgi:hypothetical protein
MKVALIPPLGWESYLAQSTGILMALALETCIESMNYPASMRLVRGTSKALLILDNGAAEGQQAKNGAMNKFAQHLGAHELVLPDVLGSRMGTIAKVHEYFRYTKWDTALTYMGVVQGDSVRHAQQCIRDYAGMQVRSFPESPEVLQPIKTLGIPRRLIQTTEEFSVRIDLANWITEHYGRRFEIHFLGAAGVWPQEVKYAAKYAPQVRSIDTSLPFVFAHHNVDLAAMTSARPQTRKLERPTGYMVGSLVNRNPTLIQSNIDTYLAWARS